ELASLTEIEFRTLFRHSPIKRIKRARFVRNICVALGNVGTKEDLPVLRRLADDQDLLIAEHASWGAQEIALRISKGVKDAVSAELEGEAPGSTSPYTAARDRSPPGP